MGDWYQMGFEGAKEEQQRIEESQKPDRFWLKPGTSKEVVIVDDDPFCIWEHNPKIDGNFGYYYTCIRNIDDDVVCCSLLGPNSRQYVGFLTAVDCSKWEDRRGNEHQYELRLLPLKLNSQQKFDRKKKEEGSLIGLMYKASRDSAKDVAVGGEWEKERTVDMKKLFEFVCYRGKKLSVLWDEAEEDEAKMKILCNTFQIKPNSKGKLPREIPAFNYFEVLKPLSPKDLRMALGRAESASGDSKDGASSDQVSENVKSEDVPF